MLEPPLTILFVLLALMEVLGDSHLRKIAKVLQQHENVWADHFIKPILMLVFGDVVHVPVLQHLIFL